MSANLFLTVMLGAGLTATLHAALTLYAGHHSRSASERRKKHTQDGPVAKHLPEGLRVLTWMLRAKPGDTYAPAPRRKIIDSVWKPR